MRCKPLILIIILLLTGKLFSQPVFEHIGSEHGLSSNKTADILQDMDGFYWIATAEGLNRFDGSTFKIFRHDKNDSSSLSHNNCTALLEDENGDIWIATAQGVNRYIRKKGVFKRYYFHYDGMNDNILNYAAAITKDSKGNIWVAAFGLWKISIKDDAIKGYLHNENQKASMSDASQCLRLSFDKRRNGLWIATSYELNYFNINTEQFYHHANNPGRWPVFTWRNKWPSATSDKEGNVWLYNQIEKKLYFFKEGSSEYDFTEISLSNTLALFMNDGNGNVLFSMEQKHGILYNWNKKKGDTLKYFIYEPAQAVNYKITQLYNDKKSNTWLCTLNGLFVSRNTDKTHRVFFVGNNQYGLPKSVTGLVMRNGKGWIGINNNLYEYDFNERKMDLAYQYPSPHGFIPLLNIGDTVLWAAIGNKVVLLDFAKRKIISETLTDGSPYFLSRDRRNRFWLGTWDVGFYKLDDKGKILNHYTTENGLGTNNLISCFSDGVGSLWIGLNAGAGFTRFDLNTETFENFSINAPRKNLPQINTINAILPDKSGNIWLGTYGAGIYYYDSKNKTSANYTVQDGLSGDYINTLSFDNNGNLWISSVNGIDIMNVTTKNIYHINESMRFGSNDHIYNVSKAGSDSFFYFAANKILFINPNLYEKAYSTPEILISDFKVLDKEYPEPASIKSLMLPYKKNFFTVTFSVLKESPAIPANYKYKLDGFDKEWVQAGNRGIANYTNVPPGKYRLLLNATDEIGRWKNEPAIILITIAPPFWKTWWFITLVSIFVLSGLWFFYRYRIAQVKRMYALRSKISQDLHDEVASTLSGIRLYSEMAKQQLQNKNTEGTQQSLHVISSNANDMAQDMSDIIWAINPSNDSFKKLLQKLKSYATEVSAATNMKFDCIIEEQIPEEKLTMQQRRNIYLICKEAINNAVKYSLGKNLKMSVEKENHFVKIKIQDNGHGFDSMNRSEGNGLANMKERANEIEADLKIYSQNGDGTFVELTVKL